MPDNQSKKRKSFIRRSILGFLSGIVLSYLIFLVMILQLEYSLVKATWISSVLAVILTLGLAFSENIQCITMLLLPQFCSKRGRTVLIAYTWLITLSTPGLNITKNTEVLATSLSCGQNQLKSVLDEIYLILKKPFVAIKHAVNHIVKVIEKVLLKVRKALIKMKDLIFSILNVIQDAFKFLANIVSICNKTIGTPFQRCISMFDEAIKDCRLKFGYFHHLCNITYLPQAICYSVKFLDYVCMLLDFISDSIINVVKEKLNEFTNEIRQMFYVSITFHHSFHFHTNASKTLSEVKKDIFAEMHERSKAFLCVMSWMQFISSIFFLWMIIKILRYKSKFVSSYRYDNYYLNKYLYEIDARRIEMGKDRILPLTRKERNRYIELTSIHLIRSERLKLYRSASFLIVSSVQIISILITDYSLYWILAIIHLYGSEQTEFENEPLITLGVTGQGFLAELYAGIINIFEPLSKQFNVDPTPCLPNPHKPNFNRYLEIVVCLLFCWLLIVFEPYGLRLRQVIMNRFFPHEARERAVWLYNQIQNRRGSFIKYARRQARRKFLKDKSIDSITFLNQLRAKYNHIWIVRKILGESEQKFCMLCGTPFKKSSDVQNCVEYNCIGRYCLECFKELNGTCSLCMNPVDYGDNSDISEELDSSDDPIYGKYANKDDFIIIKDSKMEKEYFFEIISESTANESDQSESLK